MPSSFGVCEKHIHKYISIYIVHRTQNYVKIRIIIYRRQALNTRTTSRLSVRQCGENFSHGIKLPYLDQVAVYCSERRNIVVNYGRRWRYGNKKTNSLIQSADISTVSTSNCYNNNIIL